MNKSGIDATRGDINFVLQNAITFAARWRKRFSANNTRQSPFTKTTGETIMVDMMWLSRTTVPYIVSDGWRGVRLDYTDGELAAFVLIPDDDMEQVPLTTLRQAVSQLCRPNETMGRVAVELPRFTVTSETLRTVRLYRPGNEYAAKSNDRSARHAHPGHATGHHRGG